jgi:hypothetical protein
MLAGDRSRSHRESCRTGALSVVGRRLQDTRRALGYAGSPRRALLGADDITLRFGGPPDRCWLKVSLCYLLGFGPGRALRSPRSNAKSRTARDRRRDPKLHRPGQFSSG